MINIFIYILLCVVLGVLIGQYVKHKIQKSECPYCSCRDCCNIGYGIDTACSEVDQKPFVCKSKN